MNRTSFAILLVVGIAGAALLWSENSAQAQYYVRGRGAWYRPYGYGGWGGWGWNAGGGTVAQGYGEGLSQVIRARGQAEKDNAQAQLTWQEVRSKNIENNEKAADAYWAMKERYQQRRETERQQNAERAARNRAQLESAGNSSRMRGLGPDGFDPVTGKINWPLALQAPEFEEYRAKLDQLFEHRTLIGDAAGPEIRQEILATTNAMRDALRQQITSMASEDYIDARKFIDGLAFEGRS